MEIWRLIARVVVCTFPGMARKLLKTRDVLDELGISNMTLWRWIKAGTFPQPIKVGSRNAWTRADLDLWIESRRAKPAA